MFEVVYGGARGGGKTDACLGEWALHAKRYGQNAKGLFLRRTQIALLPTIERAKRLFRPLGAVWKEQEKRFVWPNGATLYFRYLDNDSDADNYQGHDYTRVYVEELTQFADPTPLDKIKATLRSGAGVPTGFRASCNPGGPGHQWVKDRYINEGAWKIVKSVFINPFTAEEVSRSRVFIPAKLSDNPQLLRNDPGYVANLFMSGSKALVQAWLQGDWDVVEGAFFDCWDSSRHIIEPFELPADWARFRSGDWGSAKPFSFGWWAIVGDDTRHPTSGALLPRGAIIRYREWYGCEPGKPNKGLKLTAEQVGKGLADRETEKGVGLGVLDPAAFAEDGGPSIASRVTLGSGDKRIFFRRADNKRVSQRGAMGGWDMMRQRLIGTMIDADGNHDPHGRPMIYTFSTCRDSIRTIPALQHDARRAEDLDTEMEDHAADEWRYACMSRPWVRSRPVEAEKKFSDYRSRDTPAAADDWKAY